MNYRTDHRPLKILQIVGNSAFGGATFLILEWCKYLTSLGCQVGVLSTDKTTLEELRKICDINIVQNVYIPRNINPFMDVIAFLKLLFILLKEHYDVIHTYTATPGFIGRIAAWLARVPVVLHHQAGWTVTDYSSPMERFVYTPLEYMATLASTRGICVSHSIKQQAAQLHIAPLYKLVTICNGINPQPFITASENRAILRSTLRIPNDCLVIGSTGRLSIQKDNASLIRGAARLREILPDINYLLLLAGDGPDLHHLEALTHKLNLTEYVRFLGFWREIPEFLAAIDIFVSATLREGMSLSILEAMAAARPIIATSIAPNAELIEHEVTGLLVSPGSPEQIANAIIRYIVEPDLAKRCTSTARQRLLSNYTIDKMFKETWDLYTALFENKHR